MKLKILLCIFLLVFVFSITDCKATETIKHKKLEPQSVKADNTKDSIKKRAVAELYKKKEDIIKFLYEKYTKGSPFTNMDIILYYHLKNDKGNKFLICNYPDMLTNEYFSEIDLENSYLLIPNKYFYTLSPQYKSLLGKSQTLWWYEDKYTLKIFQNLPGVGALVNARDQDDIFLIKGLKGVDGDSVKNTLILKYAGPYTYETVRGDLRTIHSFDLYDRTDFGNKFWDYMCLFSIDEKYNNGEFFKKEIFPTMDKYLEKQMKK